MYIITCLELNFVAVAMCLMLYFQQPPQEKGAFFGSRHFNRMLWMTILILTLNAIGWIIEGYFPKDGAHAHMVIMSLFFLSQTVLSLELTKYCASVCNYRVPRWLKLIAACPVVINAVLLTVNSFIPFAYHMSASNSYERLPLFSLIVIWPLLYIIASVIMCAVRYVRSASYEKDITFKMLAFTMTVFASSVLSAVVYGFTPWPVIALCLVFLYLNVHSKQARELGMLAYKDALTGVRNATAHSFLMKELDKKIQNGSAAFAIVVADANDLKIVNDCYGHNAGDQLLIQSAKLLCDTFAHSPVHRIGGDEFSVILEGGDYDNRDSLIRRLLREMPYVTYAAGGRECAVSIAIGMADYDPKKHFRSADVFQTADHIMYANKSKSKKTAW